MKLSPEELERYARHIVLPELGGAGQQALNSASVLVVGAGGLGSPVIEYLAAAGVGHLTVVDDDVVSLSNLQRQTIHRTADCGIPKVESAARMVAALNPHVRFSSIAERLTAENGDALVSQHDIVVDGCDNFATRYLLADICQKHEKTLITAAVGRFDATITTLKPHCVDADGLGFPRYCDIFPNQPPDDLLPTCEEAGIIGALTGIIGSVQAMETIKEIAGIGDSLAGRLLLFDAKAFRWQEISAGRRKS